MRRLFIVATLYLALAPGALADAEREIEYLLAYVADSGCTFHRNGRDHASADAADHLRLKYRRGRRYAESAEDFIDHLATGSSWSGRAYSVSCGEFTEPTADWLRRALADYRAPAD